MRNPHREMLYGPAVRRPQNRLLSKGRGNDWLPMCVLELGRLLQNALSHRLLGGTIYVPIIAKLILCSVEAFFGYLTAERHIYWNIALQ